MSARCAMCGLFAVSGFIFRDAERFYRNIPIVRYVTGLTKAGEELEYFSAAEI